MGFCNYGTATISRKFAISAAFIFLTSFYILTGLATSVSAAPSKTAQAKQTIDVAPAYTEIEISKPEEQKTIGISYTNNTSSPISLDLKAIDFRQEPDTGVIQFIGESTETYNYSLVSYMSLETTQFELAPGEKKIIKIVITNRDDLRPGGHYAAIVATLVQDTKEKQAISPALSALFLLRKTGGEQYNLSLTNTNWPDTVVFSYPKILDLEFQNQGNIHVTPYGTINIYDLWNRKLAKGIINNASRSVFPETRRTLSSQIQLVTWSLPVSLNSMVILGRDDLGKTSFSYRETFLYINPFVPVIFVVIMIGLVLLLLKLKNRK
jgi:hypothetical protein